MAFFLSPTSVQHLVGVHPDLINVVERAIGITTVDFMVLASVRTLAQEAQLVKAHKSTTMHSRHLPNMDGYSCAVDLGAMVDGALVWEPISLYAGIWAAMQQAAKDLGIPLEWGGNWTTFKDYDHFQLPWVQYP